MMLELDGYRYPLEYRWLRFQGFRDMRPGSSFSMANVALEANEGRSPCVTHQIRVYLTHPTPIVRRFIRRHRYAHS